MNLAMLYIEKLKVVKRAPWLTATEFPPTLICFRTRFPGCRLSLPLPAPGCARAVPDVLAAARSPQVVPAPAEAGGVKAAIRDLHVERTATQFPVVQAVSHEVGEGDN